MNIDMNFYVKPTLNRLNGGFLQKVFTVYYNDKYVVVLALNVKETMKFESNIFIMIF